MDGAQVEYIVDGASGVLFMLMGIALVLIRPRRPHTTWFAIYEILFGARFIVANANGLLGGNPWANVELTFVNMGLDIAAAVAMVMFLRTPLMSGVSGRFVWPFFGVAIATTVWWTLTYLGTDFGIAASTPYPRLVQAAIIVFWLNFGMLWTAAYAAAIRYMQPGAKDKATVAFLGAALALYPLAFTIDLMLWWTLAMAAGERVTASGVTTVAWFGAAVAGLVMMWSIAAYRTRRRAPANVAGFLGAAGLLCMILLTTVAEADQTGSVVVGPARLIAIGILGYAILRHRFMGLDVRIKWTLKQSTIAAVFIATIFVVSEGAQIVFGDGNEWVGLAAGGLLVFALAPLQRFAERVSDKAMPNVKPLVEMDDAEREHVYTQAAQAAWADGNLSRDERAMLDRMRESLGLGDGQAARIERSVAA